MKGNNFNEEKDLILAKEFLDKMLALLNEDEKNDLLKHLLDVTEHM